MASARDDQQPYERSGAGGKFRKRPLRRSLHTTPYDRGPPPPVLGNPNGDRRAWLSKLVDPAQRLIASGANRLFASVFRRRLLPPSPPPQPHAPASTPERDLEARSNQQEVVSTDSHRVQKESLKQNGGPSNASGDLNELEHLLLQKTFTRFEIERLTAMLHSRTVDLETGEQKKISEVTPLRLTPLVEGNRKESGELSLTPALGNNRAKNQHVSTPIANSPVLEGDVASPTELVELAKSYMHKRPISPTRLGFRSQSMVENSPAIFTRNLNTPSRSHFTPLAPKKNSGAVDARENGFTTPRSIGRTAIYNMARTPYSRVHPIATSKGIESARDVFGRNSSSQNNTPEGGIKRRSSIFDNDIGSYGAIRRTRQKSNLSYRGLIGASASNLSSASKFKPQSYVNAKSSAENGDNNAVLRTTVPSKSSEMASKILQQLDAFVSPEDKSSKTRTLALTDKSSPSKLSPSMLRGQALKSLEHMDSSNFFEHSKVLTGSPSKEIVNLEASTSGEQPKVKENDSAADYRFTSKTNGITLPRMNGGVSTVPDKDAIKTSVFSASNLGADYPQKNRPFRMSAFEDFVDLDEDILPNGTTPGSVSEEKEIVNFSLPESKRAGKSEFVFQERHAAPALAEVNPVTTEVYRKDETGNCSVVVTTERSSNIAFPTVSFPSVVNTDSTLSFDKGTPVKDSIASPVSNFEGKVPLAKDTSVASPIFNDSLQSSVKDLQSDQSVAASDPKPEFPSSFSTPAVSFPKFSESNKADNKSNSVFKVPLTTPEPASTPTATTFSISTSPMNVSPNNGSSTLVIASSNPTAQIPATASSTPVFSFTSPSTPSVPATSLFKFESSVPSESPLKSVPPAFSFGSASAPAPTPQLETSPVTEYKFGISATSTAATPALETFPASNAPVFKFASSMPSMTTAPVPDKSNADSEPVEAKQETSLSNLIAPPAMASTSATPIFGFTASSASTSANQSQNIPVQFSSTTSLPTFGINGSTNSSFSTSQNLKPSGFGSSSSESNLVSSSGGNSTSSALNFSWQPPKSHLFNANSSPSTGFLVGPTAPSSSSPGFSFGGSTAPSSSSPGFAFGGSTAPSSISTGFSFGASSASSSSSSGVPFGATSSAISPATTFSFGASTNTSLSPGFAFGASSPSPFVSSNSAASSSSVFNFNSSSPAPAPAPTQPMFGNPNPGFAFGNPNPSKQMSMEDSMAEDTVQTAGPTNPVFGQPPVAQLPSGFAFGGQPNPGIVNPFQLGSQPNAASPSPFQASGSFGSNFSMGSAGSGADKSNRKFVKVKHKQRKK